MVIETNLGTAAELRYASRRMEELLTTTYLNDLALHPLLLRGLEKAEFTHCTPIQAATLPLALAGRDVTGQAQTGTGKTAAFLLALMDRL